MDSGAGETFIYRYDPVYAKQLTINKGVDNVLLFEFINQQEKPVNITGSTFLFRVISTNGDQLLLEKPMVILNAPTGRAKVTLTGAELLEVLAQPANYSIQRSSGNLTEAVFTNAQAGARAPVNIVDSILPQHIPSAPLLIPTTKLSAQASLDGTAWGSYSPGSYWSGNPNGGNYWNSFANTEFYIPNYTSSSYKSFTSNGVGENNGTTALSGLFAGLWSSTSAISSIEVDPQDGSAWLVGSTFYLYGLAAIGTTPVIYPKATGGDIIVNDGTYWYHAFLSSSLFTPSQTLSCDAIVVAGGGGSGYNLGGGGGAGGLVALTAQSLTAQNYTVTVGGGGSAGTGTRGVNGSNSRIGALTAAVGGGGGGSYGASPSAAQVGGSGGGGNAVQGDSTLGAAGTSTQGFAGGNGSGGSGEVAGGGGGGATAVGGVGTSGTNATGGAGGAGSGSYSSWGAITNTGQLVSSTRYYAGGGGGGANNYLTSLRGGYGGNGGGGNGGGGNGLSQAGIVGTANTGGGGGGGGNNTQGAAGGSGIVIIRYTVA